MVITRATIDEIDGETVRRLDRTPKQAYLLGLEREKTNLEAAQKRVGKDDPRHAEYVRRVKEVEAEMKRSGKKEKRPAAEATEKRPG